MPQPKANKQANLNLTQDGVPDACYEVKVLWALEFKVRLISFVLGIRLETRPRCSMAVIPFAS